MFDKLLETIQQYLSNSNFQKIEVTPPADFPALIIDSYEETAQSYQKPDGKFIGAGAIKLTYMQDFDTKEQFNNISKKVTELQNLLHNAGDSLKGIDPTIGKIQILYYEKRLQLFFEEESNLTICSWDIQFNIQNFG